MSYGNPQLCRNGCGAWIYFDKDSAAGHPSADKWLPLEYNHDSGIKTGLIHQCSKRSDAPKFRQNMNLTTSSTQETKEDDSSNTNALLKIIIAELQRLIKLFEEQQRKEDNVSKDRNLMDNR